MFVTDKTFENSSLKRGFSSQLSIHLAHFLPAARPRSTNHFPFIPFPALSMPTFPFPSWPFIIMIIVKDHHQHYHHYHIHHNQPCQCPPPLSFYLTITTIIANIIFIISSLPIHGQATFSMFPIPQLKHSFLWSDVWTRCFGKGESFQGGILQFKYSRI